jgi:transposase
MNDSDLDFLPLKVVSTGVDGKRRYEPRDKRRLIEACLQPGVSVARMARDAGVNANQLWRWIKRHEAAREADNARNTTGVEPAAFVPVLRLADDGPSMAPQSLFIKPESAQPPRREPACAPSQPSAARVSATLPNGVVVELECSGCDASLVSVMIAALGAC